MILKKTMTVAAATGALLLAGVGSARARAVSARPILLCRWDQPPQP
jgi:hypothetical protein